MQKLLFSPKITAFYFFALAIFRALKNAGWIFSTLGQHFADRIQRRIYSYHPRFGDLHKSRVVPKQTFSTKFLVPRSLAKAKNYCSFRIHQAGFAKIFRVPEDKINVVYEGVKTEEPNEAIIQAVLQKFKINPKNHISFLRHH